MSQDFIAPPRSNDKVAQIAKQLRVALEIDDEAAPDLLSLLPKLSAKFKDGKGLDIHVCTDEEMDGADAFVTFEPRTLTISRTLRQSLEKGVGRSRFTLAHEIGHLMLHSGAPKYRMAGGTAKSAFIKPFESAEHQANTFARHFLIGDAFRTGTATEISDRCKVSLVVAQIAAQEKPPSSGRIIQFPRQSSSSGSNSPPSETPKPTRRMAMLTTEAKKLWEMSRHAAGHEPDEYRLCSRGFLIAKIEYLMRNDLGWFVERGQIVSHLASAG